MPGSKTAQPSHDRRSIPQRTSDRSRRRRPTGSRGRCENERAPQHQKLSFANRSHSLHHQHSARLGYRISHQMTRHGVQKVLIPQQLRDLLSQIARSSSLHSLNSVASSARPSTTRTMSSMSALPRKSPAPRPLKASSLVAMKSAFDLFVKLVARSDLDDGVDVLRVARRGPQQGR